MQNQVTTHLLKNDGTQHNTEDINETIKFDNYADKWNEAIEKNENYIYVRKKIIFTLN